MAVTVLDCVQVLEHEIPASRRIAEQRLDFCQRLRIDGSPLELAGATPPRLTVPPSNSVSSTRACATRGLMLVMIVPVSSSAVRAVRYFITDFISLPISAGLRVTLIPHPP